MPKTVDTRSHCKVWLRACNNLPQPPPYGFLGLRKTVACSQPYLAVASCVYSFWHGVIPTSYKYKNEVGCRDDTVPKTGDTRRHCEVESTACNNPPQPPKNECMQIIVREGYIAS